MKLKTGIAFMHNQNKKEYFSIEEAIYLVKNSNN